MDHTQLMWDIVSTLVDRTSRQMTLLAAAVGATRCMRLRTTQRRLRQSWASAAADMFKKIEAHGEQPTNFNNRVRQGRLGIEVEALRGEANSL